MYPNKVWQDITDLSPVTITTGDDGWDFECCVRCLCVVFCADTNAQAQNLRLPLKGSEGTKSTVFRIPAESNTTSESTEHKTNGIGRKCD